MCHFRIGQVVKLLRYARDVTDCRGQDIDVTGKAGRVVRINQDGSGRLFMLESKMVLDSVIPEDCDPIQ